MNAAQVSEYGTSKNIVVGEAAQPVPATGQELVKIVAASVNPFDVTLRSGAMAKQIPLSLPYTIGGDFAGILESSGQELYGTANVAGGGSGSMAEYCIANSKNMAPKPTNISWIEAASLPLVGCSALQAIEEHIGLYAGQKILIHGGAGGIGSIAIQLAKICGAYVTTTAGTRDSVMLKSLGADQVIDYKSQDFTQIVSEYDAVFDTVGGEVTSKSLTVLKSGGILVTMIGEIDEPRVKELGVQAIRQNTGVSTERLIRLTKYVEGNRVKPVIDKVFPLDQVREAYEYFENDHPKGKVVVEIAAN